jgi:hypothetical protein
MSQPEECEFSFCASHTCTVTQFVIIKHETSNSNCSVSVL